jgi:hypothetical protein
MSTNDYEFQKRLTTRGGTAAPSPRPAQRVALQGANLQRKPAFSRRSITRLPASEDLWLCWRCNGRDDVSRILDISTEGIFIQTPHLGVKENMPAQLDFLVQEGRIRADAVVRHVRRGDGLGLKFTALSEEDRTRLRSLLSRLRSVS